MKNRTIKSTKIGLTMKNTIFLVFVFLLSNVWGMKDRLVTGPRGGETGKYIYKSDVRPDGHIKPDSEVVKHCLYCDSNVAFSNTTMNLLHQEPKCVKKYPSDIMKYISEYENKNKLIPICKLGEVPGCGPPPNEEYIERCDLGYSNVRYSVYFSCLVANDNTGQSMSMLYCNELLEWEKITEPKPVHIEIPNTSTTEEIKRTTFSNVMPTAASQVVTTSELDGRNLKQVSSTSNEEEESPLSVNGNMQIVVVVLAVVLTLLTIAIGTLLVRHLWKRHTKSTGRGFISSHPHSSSSSPSSPSPQAQQLIESRECSRNDGESASLINTTANSFISDGSCQTDEELGDAGIDEVTEDMTSYQGANRRQQPIGQEEGSATCTFIDDTNSNVSRNIVLPNPAISIPIQESTENNLSKFNSCPVAGERANTNNIESNQTPNVVNANRLEERERETTKSQDTARTDGQDRNEEFTPNIVSVREDPIGKMCQPRYEDNLEENSQNTEPKRLLSLVRSNASMMNEDSFEIDSGINMNIGPVGLTMNRLK